MNLENIIITYPAVRKKMNQVILVQPILWRWDKRQRQNLKIRELSDTLSFANKKYMIKYKWR